MSLNVKIGTYIQQELVVTRPSFCGNRSKI